MRAIALAEIWTFLLLLAFPSLCVRFFILHRKLPARLPVLFSYFTGTCQDLFIAFQQLFFLVAFKILFPFAQPYLFWVFVVFSTLLQLHIVFDAFLYRKTAMRMEISFLSFIADARTFWDSAKEKKVFRFVPGALLFLSFPALAYWSTWHHLKTLSFDSTWLLALCFAGLAGLVGALFLPQKLSYATDHIVFQNEMWFLKKLFRFVRHKQDQTDLNYLAKASFKPINERVSYPSSEYPLFKHTSGFSGEKQFEVSRKQGEKPHVIFLFLESFRAHNVGILGSKRRITPNFDRLAQEGILFTDFYANSVRTSRSVVSSLFGIPSDIDGSESASRIDVPLVGIPDLMKENGYQTSYLHNGPIHFENQDVFFKNHGYKTVRGKDSLLKMFPKASATSWGLPDEYLMQYAADFLEKRSDDPQFLTLFTISNHHPWNLPPHHRPPPFSSDLNRTYRNFLNTFHYTDACLGLLIDLLKEKNLSHNTILFILGDHGYPMGEHNNFVEQRYLYEENIRVPLMIYADGRILNPKIIEDPASQLDLVPTLMDMLDLTGFNLSIGSSLLRVQKETRRIFFHNPYVFKNFGCREGEHKFIYTHISQELELYDLKTDPEEKQNIARDNPKLAHHFLHAVKTYMRLFGRLYADKCLVPIEPIDSEESRSLEFSSDLQHSS